MDVTKILLIISNSINLVAFIYLLYRYKNLLKESIEIAKKYNDTLKENIELHRNYILNTLRLMGVPSFSSKDAENESNKKEDYNNLSIKDLYALKKELEKKQKYEECIKINEIIKMKEDDSKA